MNFSSNLFIALWSRSRILKLRPLTGMKPVQWFKDALMILQLRRSKIHQYFESTTHALGNNPHAAHTAGLMSKGGRVFSDVSSAESVGSFKTLGWEAFLECTVYS